MTRVAQLVFLKTMTPLLAVAAVIACGRSGFLPSDRQTVWIDAPCNSKAPDTSNPPPRLTIVAGYDHSCALLPDGGIKCWGRGEFGQLGNEATNDVGNVPGQMGDKLARVDIGGFGVWRLFGGAHNTCALLGDRRVKCWGKNSEGQLGLSDTNDRGGQPGTMGGNLPWSPVAGYGPVREVTSGNHSNCALFEDDSIRCWGGNDAGQLGTGDTEARGDETGEVGSWSTPVDLGSESEPFKVALGFAHACVLMKNGKVKCWGDNTYGQLGLGDTENRGDSAGEMGDLLPWVDLGTDACVTNIAAGLHHTCAVLVDGRAKCWGNNENGALGLGDTTNRGDTTESMGDHLPFVDLGPGATAATVGAGQEFTCVLLEDHRVKCWGKNGSGQLGQSHTRSLGDEPDEMGEALPQVALGQHWQWQNLAVGRESACVSVDTQTKCWGAHLALGAGDKNNRGDEPDEMGDVLPTLRLW